VRERDAIALSDTSGGEIGVSKLALAVPIEQVGMKVAAQRPFAIFRHCKHSYCPVVAVTRDAGRFVSGLAFVGDGGQAFDKFF
jgi:hypothetical protein